MTKPTRFANSMYTPSFSYTYPGLLNTELLQKPKINTPALSDFGRVIQGVRCGQYMNLVQPLTSVLTKGTADCAPTYTQAGSITDRKLETGPFEINLEWCKKDFIATCSVLSDSDLIGDGISGYELGGRLRTVILDEVQEAGRLDMWKVLLFGQNAYLGSSVYSGIDGVWTHLLDSFASYCAKPVYNALPKTATSTLNPNQARDAFSLLWRNAPRLLKQIPIAQRVIWTTESMWENYYDSVINDCCNEGSWQAAQDGLGTLRYRGIPVVALSIADEVLENSGNPYFGTLRHFAIYTTPANWQIGVERASDLNNLEICYDCRTKTTLIQGEMRFGVNFVHCDLQAIAY